MSGTRRGCQGRSSRLRADVMSSSRPGPTSPPLPPPPPARMQPSRVIASTNEINTHLSIRPRSSSSDCRELVIDLVELLILVHLFRCARQRGRHRRWARRGDHRRRRGYLEWGYWCVDQEEAVAGPRRVGRLGVGNESAGRDGCEGRGEQDPMGRGTNATRNAPVGRRPLSREERVGQAGRVW